MTKFATILDATDQSLGRLASQVAILLQGKNSPAYKPHELTQQNVIIENIKHMKFTGKKMDQKHYYRHSGYPGGLKETKLKDVIATKGHAEVLRRCVKNMLPKNKLRQQMMKQLIIK